jgi:hypothetical protein
VTIKNDTESLDNIKMPKIAVLTRLLLSFTVNMVGAAVVTAILPLHLAFAESPTDFVLNATAIYFICELDNLGETVKFWLNAERRGTPSIKADSSRFEPKILSKEDDMGIEIRQNQRYNHVEFDRHSAMKIVMKWKTPLQNSYRITQAKVDNSQKFHITNIKQPVEESIQHADDDGNIPVLANHYAMCKTKKQVVAVANLAHPKFDCTIFNPTATMSEILYHANLELQNELKSRRFSSVVGSGSSPEGEQLVVFAKYNNCTPSGSGCAGEVWIYLDDDDKVVKKLFASSANAADSSADDDNESDEVNDNRKTEGNYSQGNFCSSSRLNNTIDLKLDITKKIPDEDDDDDNKMDAL